MVLRVLRVSLVALLCVCAAPATAQALLEGQANARELELEKINTLPPLMARAQAALGEKDLDAYVEVLERMVALRPYEGDFRYRLAAAHAMNKNPSGAYNELLKLQQQGLSYDPENDQAFENVRGTEAYDFIIQHLNSNASRFGESEMVFRLKPENALFESLTYDPKTETFYVGSVHRGAVYAISKDGKPKPILGHQMFPQLSGVFGLAVDSERRRLWVATGSLPHFESFSAEEYGQAAMLSFDLESGALLASYPVPKDGRPHLLTNIAVAKSGAVYVSDSLTPMVFHIPPKGTIERLFAAPGFTSLRGIALGPEDKLLYIADYELGLYVVNIEEKQVFAMSGGERLNLGGIDGLYYYDNHLVMIQNGISPKRIMRVALANEGLSLGPAQPLSANQPEFENPTFGVVSGSELFFIANSQWHKYAPNGQPLAGAQLNPVLVMKTDLDLGREAIPSRS